MTNIKNVSYTNYFKKGFINNFTHITLSLIISLLSVILVFNTLDNIDYILYSVSLISTFLFVKLSTLEFNLIVRKHVPVLENKKAQYLTLKLIRYSIGSFTLLYLLYIFICNYFNLYNFFEGNQYIFFASVFLFSFVQILINYLGEYLSAKQKFDQQEKLNIIFLVPTKVLVLIVFYFFYQNLIFILFGNFLIRVVAFLIVKKVSGLKIYKKNYFDKFNDFKNLFSFKENIKYSFKLLIYNNYPLIFFSYLPIYLAPFTTTNDIAVVSLAISLFNSIKPILNGVHAILNPAIQKLNKKKDEIKLENIIELTYLIFNKTIVAGIMFLFITLNFVPITSKLFKNFSYNLFSDLSITAIFLSFFYILTQLFSSYFMSKNLEKLFFNSSIASFIASITCWIIFGEYFQGKVNLVLLIILVFYLVLFFLLMINKSSKSNLRLSLTIYSILIFLFSLVTFHYSNLFLFIFLNLLNIILFFFQIDKILFNTGVTSKRYIVLKTGSKTIKI